MWKKFVISDIIKYEKMSNLVIYDNLSYKQDNGIGE